MKKHSHLNYNSLQRIKAQEYERFFEKMNRGHYPFLNHLGEIKWMTEEEAQDQHEFFLYSENPWFRLKKKLHLRRYPDWNKLADSEKQLRLQFRAYLEKKHFGGIQPETAQLLPPNGEEELSPEKIESIPVTLDVYQSASWNKGLISGLLVLIIIMAAAIYFFPFNAKRQSGDVVIETNVKGASVYINDAKRGYADFLRTLRNIPAGPTRISLKKSGYTITPPFYEVEIIPDSTLTLFFRLEAANLQDQGYLKVMADYGDSRLFINDDFYGILSESPLVSLPRGDYVVSVKKTGYESSPENQYVSVAAGDTSITVFQQKAASGRRYSGNVSSATVSRGALEIRSNIIGARIFLNERDTGKETDYVFTEIPLGSYKIKVAREGYQPIPPEHVLTLTGDHPAAEISFELVKQFEKISIRTNPPEGDIYIDGKFAGKGTFEGPLKIGSHKVSFGSIAEYNTPRERTIAMQPNAPLNLQVDYFPQLRLMAEISDNGNLAAKNCEVKNGFTLSNRGFSASEEAGPEIFYSNDLKNYFWKFGFAFPYRNPKGNDALQISFRLPQDLKYEQNFTLKMQAAASRDRYPLAMSTKIDIKIKLNGHILSYQYAPEFYDEAGGMEKLEWDVSRYVKPGLNALEISTTEDNNVYYLVKSINISN